jgi:hypothetical protein
VVFISRATRGCFLTNNPFLQQQCSVGKIMFSLLLYAITEQTDGLLNNKMRLIFSLKRGFLFFAAARFYSPLNPINQVSSIRM